MVKEIKIIECICGNKNYHSVECRSHNRNLRNMNRVKNLRKTYKENHLCLSCGKKIEPERCPNCNDILGFKVRCKKCLDKLNKRQKGEVK